MQTPQMEGEAAAIALQSHLNSLQNLCESIKKDTPSLLNALYKPPIIDRSTTYTDTDIRGLAKFESLCSKELDHHLYLRQSKMPLDSFSSNASFLVAVWREVMASPKPVIEIYPQIPIPKQRPFKFDVISANGNQWHKINTITRPRLLSEILEMESTSDEDSSVSSQSDQWSYISVVRQCLDMREASNQNPVCLDRNIRLVFRLTRLCKEERDSRIQSIYQYLRGLGIDLRFGEPAESGIEVTARSIVPIPSTNLNLDLSMLVALISDISHSPLPETQTGAEARFQPIQRVWKRKTSRIDGLLSEDRAAQQDELGPEEHSRALISQLQQEMHSALIPELMNIIASACEERGSSPMHVRFWTTREAMERCLTIATKIAGPRELTRAHCLFRNSTGNSATKTFWSQSRHQLPDGPFKDLHVRVIEDEPKLSQPQRADYSFSMRLESACQMVIETESVRPTENAFARDFQAYKWCTNGRNTGIPPKKPSLHTVRSMLAGSRHGMTTLTANRMSVKQMIRVMGLGGLTSGDGHAAFMVTEPKTLAEQKRTDGEGHITAASIWTLEPRSLAETMVTTCVPDGTEPNLHR